MDRAEMDAFLQTPEGQAIVAEHQRRVNGIVATLREVYTMMDTPPPPSTCAQAVEIGASVAPASRWQRLRWFLRRIGRP